MRPIPKSDLYYANRYARIILKGYAEVLGQADLDALLRFAHLEQWIGALPPDNLERQFDFADFGAIHQALDEIYGPSGGSGLAIRAGRAAVPELLDSFGALIGAHQVAFKMQPLQTRLRMGLVNSALASCQTSDQYTTLREDEAAFVYTYHRCPVCWGRPPADRPLCHHTVGMLAEGLNWLSGGQQWLVRETRCLAMGDPVCEFSIPKTGL